MLGGVAAVAGTGVLGLGAAQQRSNAEAPGPDRGSVPGDGTPEQVHLEWGRHPATEVTVSWISPGRSERPGVLLQGPGGRSRQCRAEESTYTDGLNGETVSAYHAAFTGLRPATQYSYTITTRSRVRWRAGRAGPP